MADARETVRRVRGQLGPARGAGQLGTRDLESAPAADVAPIHAELDALLRRLK